MSIKILRIIFIVLFFIPNILLSCIYNIARFLLTRYVALELEMFREWNDDEMVMKTAKYYCEGFSISRKEMQTINDSAGCEAITVNIKTEN